MRIKNIKISKADLELTRPYYIAFKYVSTVENGIVEISTDDGKTGFGSFNPSYEVVHETLEDAISILDDNSLSFLMGRDIREINLLCNEIQSKFEASPGARAGLEIALYDLWGQYLNAPLSSLFGQKIQSMPTSITIGIKDVYETEQEAIEYVNRGFKIIKIKTGHSLEVDIERIAKIREVIGEKVKIIVDANQGYSKSELVDFYNRTIDYGIKLIEQPLKAGQEANLDNLPKEINKLLAADESLIDIKDAQKLIQGEKTYGFFNIKLMKCGGISQAQKIAELAFKNQIPLMWGCNDESIISITAALHTAFACWNTEYIDLDGSLDLRKDVIGGGFRLIDGIMYIPDRPGLGLVI